MSKMVYRFAGSEETYRSTDAFQVGGASHTRVKVQSMTEILESESVRVPAGLSREEVRAFILEHAAK